MEIRLFKEKWESPIHDSIDDVFNRAGLNETERNIFRKYEKTHYWLLRSKLQYSSSYNENNYIKQISRVLLNLHTDRVIGSKSKLIKEMFAGEVHKYEKSKFGIRSKKNTSNKIDSMFFELKILTFLLKNTNWEFKLPDNRNGKIPEYIAMTELGNINIEAKLLNQDKIMDNIFGDDFIEDIFHRTKTDIEKGFARIRDQVKRNYENSIEKYKNIDKGEYFIIFIEGYYKIEFMGQPVSEYLKKLPLIWKDNFYNRLIGVVFVTEERILFIENINCNPGFINIFKPWLYDFNSFIPEYIEEYR